MTASSLLDPQLAPIYVGVPNPLFSNETIPMLRPVLAGAPIQSDGLTVTEHHLERADGTALRLVVISPDDADRPLPIVLHCHPGGWMMGRPETSGPTLVDMARNFRCVIVSVDYRLAPEHPFPAAHDDAMTALTWVRTNANTLNIDANRIVLAGESAGATIIVGVAMRCRDEGIDDGIIGLSLIYAPLDDRTTAMPPHPFAGTIGLNADHMRFAWASYLGNASDAQITPYAAPARAESLSGLPPVFLAVGALDPVIDENLAFAQRLIRDGVPTAMHIFSGAPHGFDRLESAEVTGQMRRLRIEHLHRCVAP